MKVFHISDILSVTTGRLVSNRHMDGVYEILNFLTSDNLFTHQLPRACRECEPWLRAQFPRLMKDDPLIEGMIAGLSRGLEQVAGDRKEAIARWVEAVRVAVGMPELIPVYEMGADLHTRIDPVEEAKAMVGDENVVTVELPEEAAR